MGGQIKKTQTSSKKPVRIAEPGRTGSLSLSEWRFLGRGSKEPRLVRTETRGARGSKLTLPFLGVRSPAEITHCAQGEGSRESASSFTPDPGISGATLCMEAFCPFPEQRSC